MSLKTNYVNEINELLMIRRSPDDVDSFTLYMPEHKFKKNSEKFNYALTTVYDRYKDQDVKLFHIILSLQEFFDMELLVNNILDSKLKRLVELEMEGVYHMNKTVTRESEYDKKTID